MPKTKIQSIDSRRALTGACSLGTLGVLVFAILPLLLGVVADHLQLDESQTGLMASTYFGGFFLMTLTSVIWVRRVDWRWLVAIGAVLLLLGLALAANNLSYDGILYGLCLSGLGSAMLYALSVTLVSDMGDKDRAFAIKLVPEQAIPALLLVLLPVLVIESYGLQGVLLCLLLLCVVVIGPGFLIPSGGEHRVPGDTSANTKVNPLVFIGLAGLVVFFAGFAGLWAFAERMAHEALNPELVGMLLAMGLIGSALGPVASAWVGDRFGRMAPILLGSVLSLVALGLLIEPITAVKFGLLMAILPTSFYFALSYLFGIISDADVTGRFSSLISSALALGAAIGPGLFGVILEQQGRMACYAFVAGSIIIGCGLSLWTERRLERNQLQTFSLEQCS
ncbi:MAG: MFS transporter [Halopseudomonas sp.]